jgi:hypothetical protein
VPKFTRDHDVLDELLRQAWTLSEAEIESLAPGDLDAVERVLGAADLSRHPFADRTREELERPDVHLLRVLRNPAYFGFTCRCLFGKPDGSGPLEIAPFQQAILGELWHRQFPMLIGSRGLGKSFVLALYILLRLIFRQGSKVVIVASAFRQAKVVFEYMERLWFSSPVLRDLVGASRGQRGRDNGPRRDIDRCEFVVGDSVAVALPLGDGKKIRGLRANCVVAEEFASIPEEVYAIVVQGFGSVTADPIQNMKDFARMRVLKRLGLWSEAMDEDEAKRVRGNQSVLSGTAYYSFNHFCKYWKEYKAILATRGDRRALEEVLRGSVPEDFNWRDYSIVRVPHELIPKGYMDDKTIARARQTTHSTHHLMEYGACFANDSEGFFRRSLIEKCVAGSPDNPSPPRHASCGLVEFTAALKGRPGLRYVYGVDPAYDRDHFAVVVLELWPDHVRVVYCWTTSKSEQRRRLKRHMTKEHNFYSYAARKLRDLMKAFPCARMLVDAGSGGGGMALMEALADPKGLEPGELPVFEAPDPDPKKAKDTDHLKGDHVVELVHFRDNAWVSEANHGMKKDMEHQELVFPMLDSLALGLAMEADKAAERVAANEAGETVYQTYDTLESAMLEIEELKNELASIVISATATGLERWDTPDTRTPGAQKAGRMRKDRYSALLMANMGARQTLRTPPPRQLEATAGGFAHELASAGGRRPRPKGPLYDAPPWFQQKMAAGGAYGAAVRRGGVVSR